MKTGQFARLALRYLRPHARREAETFVYMLLGLGFTMVFPFAFRKLLDDAIPSGEFSEVLSLLAVLGVAFVVSLLAGLRRAYLSAYVSADVVRQIRTQMFDRLQSLSAGWFTGARRATCSPGSSPTSPSSSRACRRRCGRASSRSCRWWCRPSC